MWLSTGCGSLLVISITLGVVLILYYVDLMQVSHIPYQAISPYYDVILIRSPRIGLK
jgi:hypothetical protein